MDNKRKQLVNEEMWDSLIYMIGDYHFNWHNEIELIWLLKGKIEVNLEGEVYHLDIDDVILINSNYGHATFAKEPNSVALRLYISPSLFINNDFDLNLGTFKLNTLNQGNELTYTEIRKLLTIIHFHQTSNKDSLELLSAIYRLAYLISKTYIPSENKLGKRDSNNILTDMTIYIDHHYKEDISLKYLSSRFNYSTSYISKLFKTELGINYLEYLNRRRLQEAIFNLRDFNKTITDIAFEHGFKDQKSFTETFKNFFSYTPSEYRKRLEEYKNMVSGIFKSDISLDLQEEIEYKLEWYLKNDLVNQQQEKCATCIYKNYANEYNSLVNNLENLIDSTKISGS